MVVDAVVFHVVVCPFLWCVSSHCCMDAVSNVLVVRCLLIIARC